MHVQSCCFVLVAVAVVVAKAPYLVKTLSGGAVDCSEDWHPSN